MAEVFFHVGLGKNASKFLQYQVFPFFKGVKYIQRTSYKKSKDIIKAKLHKKYFLSNEFDRQMERECAWFSKDFPDAKIIVVIRRNDSWIASQYRRYIKNGRGIDFKAFLDLENDAGEWKIKDLYLFQYLEIIERYFKSKPLVILYDELKNNPHSAIQKMANFMVAKVDISSLNLQPKHTSYSEKQLKFMKKWGPSFFSIERKDSKNSLLKALYRYSRWALVYPILYLGKIMPEVHPNSPLIDPKELNTVKDFFRNDWEKCVAYAEATQQFYGLI